MPDVYNTLVYEAQGGAEMVVSSGGTITLQSGGNLTGTPLKKTAKTTWFNLDNGSGTTVDDVVIRPVTAITLVAARIVYVDVTSGVVAAATIKVGTTVGGTELVASTAYENSKAVGTITALTLATVAVAANTAVFVRHTGVAATALGQAYVEIDYTVNA